MYNGYSYCKHARSRDGGFRYRCSAVLSKACRAHVCVRDGVVASSAPEHNHSPSTYTKTLSGRYIKQNMSKLKRALSCFSTMVISSVDIAGLGMLGRGTHAPNGSQESALLIYTKNSCIRGGGVRFACASRLSGRCHAYVHMSVCNVILKSDLVHTHEQPTYKF
ncbi:Modifier of mdg4, partial [Operophtera brumata]